MTNFRILLILSLFLGGVLSGCQQPVGEVDAVTDATREEALQTLRQNLQTQQRWEKVHAAEFLLWAGYPAQVREVFEQEQRQFGQEPPYRIGIWRVLAQTATEPEEKRKWVDQVVLAFQDTTGPDRVHAAETLAKLGISPLTEAPAATGSALAGEEGPLTLYTRWGTAFSSPDSAQNARRFFHQRAIAANAPMATKRTAAYALRHLQQLRPTEWGQLAQVALAEPASSEAQVYLLSAAFVTAPADSAATSTFFKIRQGLLGFATSARKADRMEMAAALAERGEAKELPTLLSLLREENPIQGSGSTDGESGINSTEKADVRAAAGYALLQIGNRQEYFLAPADWLVIGAYLLGMLGIGFFYSRQNKSEKDFMLGGGKMNPVAVGLSLFATLLSSLSYLSYPGEIVKYGPVIFTGMAIFPLIYYVVGWFLIPRFMNLNVTSAYQILEIRLGLSIRMLATFFFLSLRFLWMATIIYVTANTAILSIFNIDPAYTLLIGAGLMVITIVYTSMGGLKAVVVTDVVQSFVLLGGAILTIVVVSAHFGSFTAWIPDRWLPHWGELKLGFDARERLTVANALLMMFVWYICSAGSDQMSIQRYLATKDVQAARKTFGVSLLTTFVAQVLLGLVGLALIAYFTANPHYLTVGQSISDQADLLFPRFILVGLPVGVSGLVAAGILAAAMSSLSSGLNSSSSVISEDLLKRLLPAGRGGKVRQQPNELKRVRQLSLFVGVFTLLLSIAISHVEGNLYDIVVKVVNLFVAPLFVLFFLALFVSFATARGTFVGGVASVAVAVAVAFFGFLGISVLFILPAALATGIVVGTLCSYLDHKVLGNPETMANRSERLLNGTRTKEKEVLPR